jgi:hypothetical protein
MTKTVSGQAGTGLPYPPVCQDAGGIVGIAQKDQVSRRRLLADGLHVRHEIVCSRQMRWSQATRFMLQASW